MGLESNRQVCLYTWKMLWVWVGIGHQGKRLKWTFVRVMKKKYSSFATVAVVVGPRTRRVMMYSYPMYSHHKSERWLAHDTYLILPPDERLYFVRFHETQTGTNALEKVLDLDGVSKYGIS